MPGKRRGENGGPQTGGNGGLYPQIKSEKINLGVSDGGLEARPVVGASRGPCYRLPWLVLSSFGRQKGTS